MSQKALDYLEINWRILFLLCLSHACILLSRLVAIAVCADVLIPWIFLMLGLHWLAISVWLNTRKADFTSAWWEERLLNILAALVYVFVYMELHESEKSRYYYIVMHILYLFGNSVFIGLWIYYGNDKDQLMLAVLTTVIGTFFLGVLLMFVYDRFCYPKRAFSFDKMNRPRVILDEELITCTDKKHYPNSKHCPMLAQPTLDLQTLGKNERIRKKIKPPLSLAVGSAALRCFPKLELSDSTPDALPGSGTPESAPIDYFLAQDKAKVLSEVPKIPSPPLFTKCPKRLLQQQKQQTPCKPQEQHQQQQRHVWTDVYAKH